jgi:hypothetical protein
MHFLIKIGLMKSNFSLITSIIAILADIATLYAFASSFIIPDISTFFMHPAFWIVLQLAFTIYGNISFGYWIVLWINKIYSSQKAYYPKDIKNTLLLFAYLAWIPTYLIWIITAFIICGKYNNYAFPGIMSFLSLFIIPFGGILIAHWDSLLARTINPQLQIKIEIDIN